jgi:hypothetical protein
MCWRLGSVLYGLVKGSGGYVTHKRLFVTELEGSLTSHGEMRMFGDVYCFLEEIFARKGMRMDIQNDPATV